MCLRRRMILECLGEEGGREGGREGSDAIISLFSRSNSPGKLLQYLVDNGCHVNANTPYAEIEVMKMVTTLSTREPGM